MRTRYITVIVTVIVVLVTLAVAAVVVYAGSLDSTGAPTAAAGQMYTLGQIYNRINDGTAATKMTTFTEPGSGPTAGTGKTLDEIYDLAGQRARVPKTGDTYTDGSVTGEDGELLKGVAWPNPRFTDNLNGTVTDNLTGLIWLKDASCADLAGTDADGRGDWSTALSAANSLANGTCSLSDGSTAGQWRLPNVREMQSLVHYGVYNPAVPNTAGTGQWGGDGDPFTGVQSSGYWPSTTNASGTSYAWVVGLHDGSVYNAYKTNFYPVWPVRGGQ